MKIYSEIRGLTPVILRINWLLLVAFVFSITGKEIERQNPESKVG